jgi:hypothetical protein
MIQITIDEHEPIGQFIEARAVQIGRPAAEIAADVVRDGLILFVRSLHEQFMTGEISQGKMAEMLGISRVDLIHLLDALNLPVTNL